MTENAIMKPPEIHLYYTTYSQGNVLNFQGTYSVHLSGNSYHYDILQNLLKAWQRLQTLFSGSGILNIAAVKHIINELYCQFGMGAVDYHAHNSVFLLEGVNLGKVGSIV